MTEDGLVVGYPHPAPGLPVLPLSASAPHHPLERTPDGDWTLTDPATGHTRRFGPPADGAENGIAPISQLEDRNGNLIAFEYDAHGTPWASPTPAATACASRPPAGGSPPCTWAAARASSRTATPTAT